MSACTHCGSRETVPHGKRRRSGRILRDERAEREPVAVSRFLCRSCGRTSTLRDDAAALRLRDYVVARVFEVGQSAAAVEVGLSRAAVQRRLRAWGDEREPAVFDAEPPFVLVETAEIRGAQRVLVCDVDRETLVEILEDPNALPGWLSQPGRAPALQICLPLDPRLRDLARAALPQAETMVAPASVARSLTALGDGAYRALRRRPEHEGSNSLPAAAEFRRASRGRFPPGSEWPNAFRALAGALRTAHAILAAGSRAAAERLWPEFAIACAGDASRAVASLFATWREEILCGIENGFVDRVAKLAEAARRSLSRRRPALGFPDLRCLALLQGFERAVEPSLVPRLRKSMPVSRGRPLADLGAL